MDLGEVVAWVQHVIAVLGYPGIGALIALEGFFPSSPRSSFCPWRAAWPGRGG